MVVGMIEDFAAVSSAFGVMPDVAVLGVTVPSVPVAGVAVAVAELVIATEGSAAPAAASISA